jgi:RNA recognition motif-containing protein
MDYEAPSGSDPEEQPIIKRMLKLKFDITYDAVREVQFCEHRTESPCSEKPLGRTLFLSRVPPWANELGLARIFAINGPVQKVYLSKKASASMSEEDLMDYTGISRFLWPLKDTSGFKFAYVVFEKPSSLKKAILSMDLTHPFILSNDENPIFTGMHG